MLDDIIALPSAVGTGCAAHSTTATTHENIYPFSRVSCRSSAGLRSESRERIVAVSGRGGEGSTSPEGRKSASRTWFFHSARIPATDARRKFHVERQYKRAATAKTNSIELPKLNQASQIRTQKGAGCIADPTASTSDHSNKPSNTSFFHIPPPTYDDIVHERKHKGQSKCDSSSVYASAANPEYGKRCPWTSAFALAEPSDAFGRRRESIKKKLLSVVDSTGLITAESNAACGMSPSSTLKESRKV